MCEPVGASLSDVVVVAVCLGVGIAVDCASPAQAELIVESTITAAMAPAERNELSGRDVAIFGKRDMVVLLIDPDWLITIEAGQSHTINGP